jgi:transcriptional regulator with XRE-family HTH domain
MVPHSNNKAFGAVLSRLRRSRGLSQESLALDSGLSRNYVSLMERGMRSPTLDTLIVLSSTLEIRLDGLARLILIELSSDAVKTS